MAGTAWSTLDTAPHNEDAHSGARTVRGIVFALGLSRLLALLLALDLGGCRSISAIDFIRTATVSPTSAADCVAHEQNRKQTNKQP